MLNFKKFIACTLLTIFSLKASEYDHTLNQFLSHTYFKDVRIVNKIETDVNLHIHAVKWRQLAPGQQTQVAILHYKSIQYNGRKYTHDFSVINSKAESTYIQLTYAFDTLIKPEETFNGSMVQHITSPGLTPIQYTLNLPQERLQHPSKQTQPLIIHLVHHAAPILAQLLPCNQQNLRQLKTGVPNSTQYFYDKVLSKSTSNIDDCHNFFQKSYDNTIVRLHNISEDSPFKIPLDLHTIWLSDPQNPKLPPQQCYDLLKDTTKVCTAQHGWRYHIWVNHMQVIPPCPDEDTAFIVHDVNDLFKVHELKPYTFYYSKTMQAKNYGKASDLVRLCILYLYGGVYRDTDYAFIKTPKTLHQVCTFYCGLEGNEGLAPCNAMIASSPKHFMIELYLQHISKHLRGGYDTDPLYADIKGCVYKTLFQTGPFAFAHVLYNCVQNPQIHHEILNNICIAPNPVFFHHSCVHNKCVICTWPWMSLGRHLHRKDWIPNLPTRTIL